MFNIRIKHTCLKITESAPTFAGNAATSVSVAENAAIDDVVTTTVTATGTGTITYALKTQTPDSTQKKFAVNSGTGSINVAEALNFEDVTAYTLIIT